MQSGEPAKRPWAIRRWCQLLSFALAGLAEFTLVAAVVVALLSGNRNPGVLVLSLVWPIYYAGVYGISYAIAKIDQRGPATEQGPKWYRDSIPQPYRESLNEMYSLSPNVGLLVFPVMMTFFSGMILWFAATGQLNP